MLDLPVAPPTVLTAKDAVTRHMRWRFTLQLAISMQEPLTSDQMDQVRHSKHCAIGRWLDSNATLPMRAQPQFQTLVALHLKFHREMTVIADLIEARQFEQASRATSSSSPFVRAANDLASAIVAYDRAMPMVLPT